VAEPLETPEAILSESDRRDARNRWRARIWSVVPAMFLLSFALLRHERLSLGYVVLLACLTFFAALSHTRLRYSGWAFIILFLMIFYVPAIAPASYSWHDFIQAANSRFAETTGALTADAGNFKDAYILLGSAAFTLYGFFFLAARRVERIQLAVRLYTIAQVFPTVLALAITATLLPNSGWWRYLLLLTLLGTLYALGQEPRPYIIDVSVDREGAATFWDRWLRNRTGQAIQTSLGLCFMPLWPVAGETVFVIGLLSLLLVAAHTSTFLYLSNELPNTKRTDEQLRLLYGFKASPDFAEPSGGIPRLFGLRPNRADTVTSIPFTFPRPQQPGT
jgi:hypothetical protein